MAFIDYQNARLVQAGVCPPPPNWTEVLDRARSAQQQIEAELRAKRERKEAEDAAEMAEIDPFFECEKPLAEYEEQLYGVPFDFEDHGPEPHDVEIDTDVDEESPDNDPVAVEAGAFYPPEVCALIQPGETIWSLERNAAVAGFFCVEDYLKWRAEVNS